MLKLLFWGIIIYVVYRYFRIKAQIAAGGRQNAFQNHPPPNDHVQKEEDGDYIDYEEVK